MDSEYKSLTGYEGIEVNANGELRHVKNHKKSIKIYEDNTSHCFYARWFRGVDDMRSISMLKLIANLFVDNPSNYTIIKTIDGDKSNYKASNLQWVAKQSKGNIKAKYDETHKEQIKEYNKQYNESHKDQVKEPRKEHYEEHKDSILEK